MEGWGFWMPFLIIFGAGIIISVVQRYARDICLMKFDGCFVLAQMKDGRWIWGWLEVHSKALEILFDPPVPVGGEEYLSHVLYEQNIADIALLLRPEPAPGTTDHDRWLREMQRLSNPPLLRRAMRRLRNIFHMLRTAFSESIAAAVGIMKQRTAMGKIAGADAKATEVGQKLITSIPASYEPILEHYLSREVTAESHKDMAQPAAGLIARTGVLEEYSDKFILLRDVWMTASFPRDALRPGDAPDHFAVILPRSTSFVRHLSRRQPRPVFQKPRMEHVAV